MCRSRATCGLSQLANIGDSVSSKRNKAGVKLPAPKCVYRAVKGIAPAILDGVLGRSPESRSYASRK